jgi:20S proteasome alpha/beta subunit
MELLKQLKKLKKEIEAEGMVATLDEAIERTQQALIEGHDCHLSEDDGCEVCDMTHEEYNELVHKQADEEADRLHDELKEE